MLDKLFILVVQGLWCVNLYGCTKDEQALKGQAQLPVYSLHPLEKCEEDAPPAYSKFQPLYERDSTYMALVTFKALDGRIYQVRWNLYGYVFNISSSVEAILERSLLAGDERGIFLVHKSEVERIFTLSLCGLRGCLERNKHISYRGVRERALCSKHIAEMFPKGEYKQWQVLKGDATEALTLGEFRVQFDEGCLSCTPSCVQGVRDCIQPGTPRYEQLKQECTADFVAKVRYYAEEKKRGLQEAALRLGEDVLVRYVNSSGKTLSVHWDGSVVCDAKGRYLLDFLQDCVLLGCNLGYIDERCEKHYAFTNESLRELLCVGLAFDISKSQKIFFLRNENHLTAAALRAMPHMTWTVVTQGRLRCSEEPYTCSISFAGATLEGVPSIEQVPKKTHLLPRNFLWAVCHECVAAKLPKGVCWYTNKLCLDAPRLYWSFGP